MLEGVRQRSSLHSRSGLQHRQAPTDGGRTATDSATGQCTRTPLHVALTILEDFFDEEFFRLNSPTNYQRDVSKEGQLTAVRRPTDRRGASSRAWPGPE